MAKRELSSTLRNLKFMQRAALREENTKKDEDVKPDGNFCSPSTFNRKCVVIMEGDPHPGAIKGRMSFQSFNRSIDKLNEAASNPVSATSTGSQSGGISLRVSGLYWELSEPSPHSEHATACKSLVFQPIPNLHSQGILASTMSNNEETSGRVQPGTLSRRLQCIECSIKNPMEE
nr:uncharacterized protein LOC112003694 isoform X1 [Quercus suber]POE61709.1 hypothetical protein CFP56_51914 [Quercus suber]